jgi:hypothetical protein
MSTLSNLADLVTVRNHLRVLLNSQYRNITRDEDKALGKLVNDLDQLFLSAMSAHAANPSGILDVYDGPDTEEIIAALRKSKALVSNMVVPGDVSVVDNAQLELDFEQKEKVKRIKNTVKANKDKKAKQLKEAAEKESREMNNKIAQAKKEVAGHKKAKAIEPKGDGTSNKS